MGLIVRFVVLLLISLLLISSIDGRCSLRPEQVGAIRQTPEQFAKVKARLDLLLLSHGVDPMRIPSAPCQKLIAGSRGSFGPGCELPGREALLRRWTNWTIVAPRGHCLLLRACLGCQPCSPRSNVFMLVTYAPEGRPVLLETCEHGCSSLLLVIPHNRIHVTFIPEVGGALRPALDHVRISYLGMPSRHHGNFVRRRRISAWLAQSCESRQVFLSGDSVPSNVHDVDFGDGYPLFRVYMPGLPTLISPKSRLEPYLRFWVPYSGPAKPHRTLAVRWRPAPTDLMQRPSGPAAAISTANDRCGNWTSTGDKSVALDTCQFELVGNSGTFYSPGFPADYPSLVRCQWTVRAPDTSMVLVKVCGFSHGGGCCDRSDKVVFKEHPHQEVSAMVLSCWGRNIFYYSPKASAVTVTLTSGDWRGWSDQGSRNFWVEYFVLEQNDVFDLRHLSCSDPVQAPKPVEQTFKSFGENSIKAEAMTEQMVTKVYAQYQLATVDRWSQENVTEIAFDERQLSSVDKWLSENVTELAFDEQLFTVDSWSQENMTELDVDGRQLSSVDKWWPENVTELAFDERQLSSVDKWLPENVTELAFDEQLSTVDSWSQENMTELDVDERRLPENVTELAFDEQLSTVDSWSQENMTELDVDERQLSSVDKWLPENVTELAFDEQLSTVDSWSQNMTELDVDERQLSSVDKWLPENVKELAFDERQLSSVDKWLPENMTGPSFDQQLSTVDSWSQENMTELDVDERQLSSVDKWLPENVTELAFDEQLSTVDSWSQNMTELDVDERQLSSVDKWLPENMTGPSFDQQLSSVGNSRLPENVKTLASDKRQFPVNRSTGNVTGMAFDFFTSGTTDYDVIEVQRHLDYDWSTISHVTNSVESEVLSRYSMSTTMLEDALDPNIGWERTAGISAFKPRRDGRHSDVASSAADRFGPGVSILAEVKFPAGEMSSIPTTMQGSFVVMKVSHIEIEKTTRSKSRVISAPGGLANSALLSTLEPSKRAVFEGLTVSSDVRHDRVGVSCPGGSVNAQGVETPQLKMCGGSLVSTGHTILVSPLRKPDEGLDFLSSNEISAVSAGVYSLSESTQIMTSIPASQTASDVMFNHPDKSSNLAPRTDEPTRQSASKLIPERGLRAGPRFVWGRTYGSKGNVVHPGPYKPKEYKWFEVALSSAVRGKREAQHFNELVEALHHHLVFLMNMSSGDYQDDFVGIVPRDMNWVVTHSKLLVKFHVFLESDASLTNADLLRFLEGHASKMIRTQNSSLEILDIEVTDVNECETKEHLCDYHAACHNTQGSYLCQCDDGYTSLDSNWIGTQCMGVIYDDVAVATPSIALMAVILGAVACGLFLIVMLALITATMVQRRWQQASTVNSVLGTAIYPRLNCSDLSRVTGSPPLPSLWRSPASPKSRSSEERSQEAESCGCGWHPSSAAAPRMHVCER
uniref:uncharacterized protein n=1 Tax=Myxine glutinosa TaxID=7769 RepID=UPI00358E82BA